MGILQFPTPIPVTVGSLPNIKFMVATDSLSTLLQPGYLNSANTDSGAPMVKTDVVFALYNYSQTTQQGIFAILTVAISITGVITLALWNSGVVLPVTVNDITMFYDTLGAIYDGFNVIARHPGNIQAGDSGIQGGFISYPSSPASGKFIAEASASLGNFTAVLTNLALAQSTNYYLPDPSAANTFVAVSPGATIINNLVKAVGTTGQIGDAEIAASAVMQNNIQNNLTAAGSIVANKSSATSSGGIVTTNGMAGFLTTESLTTAGGARYSLTWNNPFITATSVGFLTTQGGTNTNNDYTFDLVVGSANATILINNNSGSPLNGNILFGYVLF